MAVTKRICQGCGCTICKDSVDVCPLCGSADIKAEGQSDLEGKTKCNWCGKLFVKTHHLQAYCPGGKCRQRKENEIAAAKLGKKRLAFVECPFCKKMFKQAVSNQYVCSDKKCQELRINKGVARKKELLGPDKPLTPTRPCHTCGESTYDYWCDRCRGKFRISNGVTGLSGTGEL